MIEETDHLPDADDDEEDDTAALPASVKNYMTPEGHAVMQEELRVLLREERPKIVEIVSWAAGNGDRSENGDYIYGKKCLREIDRRLRYLSKRLESAVVVDPKRQKGLGQVFFGAEVTYAREDDSEHTVRLVGIDEADARLGKISWLSPLATALMKSRAGDRVKLRIDGKIEIIEVVALRYPAG